MKQVHQMIFGLRPGKGLGVVASSFADSVDTARYKAALEQHIRLNQYRNVAAPPTALSYFLFPTGESAAVHRRTEPGAMGRNESHALIGSLSVDVVLGLGDWPWPVQQSALLPVLDTDTIEQVGRDAVPTLRRNASSTIDTLRTVLTHLLDQPLAPVSVIGCRDEHKLPVVWALRDAADTYLTARGIGRTWSFSTYETGLAANTPEIVSCPDRWRARRWPGPARSSTSTTRRRLASSAGRGGRPARPLVPRNHTRPEHVARPARPAGPAGSRTTE